MEFINKKRTRGIIIFFALIMLALAGRLIYIQAFCHDEFESAARSQYEIPVEGLDTRGMILDRNLMPLTGGIKEYYYIIPKRCYSEKLDMIMAEIEGRQIAKKTSSYLAYRTEAFDNDISKILKKDFNAYIFQTSSRYADEQTACHFIGYLNDDEKVGVSGIELMRQKQLAAEDSRLALWADAAGNILRGEAPVITDVKNGEKNMEERSVATTIDRRLQYVCETALAESAAAGAAVIMDPYSGEILAWASAPVFNPNNVEKYLDGGDCLINKVSQGAYAPGSVFKIVTAAAALENGVCGIEQEFECTGETTVEGITLGCSNAPEGGHGVLDMRQAMAYSCNCYFAQLGEKIGSGEIVKQAEKMGFGNTVLGNYPEETSGNLPGKEEVGPWDVTNLSIGQGRILATPLQVAKMTSIVANGGKAIYPTVFLDESHSRSESNMYEENNQVLEPKTAESIEDMLKGVMEYGTGAAEWDMTVWGKTGTAEAEDNGRAVKNCWFTGYCKAGEKTYVVTVLAEDGTSGSYNALPVFKKIAKYIKVSSSF